jgi:quercetin dioxygenase-like cupin family protein
MATTENTFVPVYFSKQTFLFLSANEDSLFMNWKMEQGGFVPPHTHDRRDEHFTMLRGEGTFTVGGEKIVAREGEKVTVPKGTVHYIRNKGNEEMECLVEYTPCLKLDRVFNIMNEILKENPGDKSMIFKMMYLSNLAGYEPFSTPAPKIINSIFNGVLFVIGKFSGWDKLKEKYL